MEFKEIQIERLSHLIRALAEVSEDLKVRVIPKQEGDNVFWDYIRAEIWEDSGRVIFFPASSKTDDRIDILANYVFCQELLEQVEEFDASDLSAEEYDNIYTQVINNIGSQVLSFFSNETSFELKCFDQDGNEIRT